MPALRSPFMTPAFSAGISVYPTSPEKSWRAWESGKPTYGTIRISPVALQGSAVYLAQKGYIEHVPATVGFAPLTKLIADYMELGGKLMVCKPCIEDRNIKESDLIDGAQITTGGILNMLALESDAQLVY